MGINGNVGQGLAQDFQVSPEGWSVMYVADQEQDNKFEVYETWIDPVRAAGPP
jgi:hypothetical protein